MRCYRKDGRVAVILKLRLPQSDGSCNGCAAFDSFYSGVADRYLSAIEGELKKLKHCERPAVINVDYIVVTDLYVKERSRLFKKYKNLVVIKREERINIMGEIRRKESLDFFDKDMGIFVE